MNPLHILELDIRYWFLHSVGLSRVMARFREKASSIRFVDRERELQHVLDIIQRGSRFVHVVYGPRGCGKTTFFELLHTALNEEPSLVCTIFALEEDTIKSLFVREKPLRERIESLVKEFARKIDNVVVLILEVVDVVVDYVVNRSFEYLVCVIDELRKDSKLAPKALVDILYNRVNSLEEHGVKTSVFIITSYHTIVPDLISTRKCVCSFMWNLDKDATRRLCELLGLPDPDIVYKLSGGNPREIRMIAELGIDKWIEERVHELCMSPVIRELIAEAGRREQLGKVLESVDCIDDFPEIRRALEELNLVIKIPELPSIYMSGMVLTEDSELGIGKHFAWQVPVYKRILEILVEKPCATPGEVAERVLSELRHS